MAFDPMVEAIRRALAKVDADPRSIEPYLDLIDAYQKCAEQENEPELLEQAGAVIRDARRLGKTQAQKTHLEELAVRVEGTLARIRAEQISAEGGA